MTQPIQRPHWMTMLLTLTLIASPGFSQRERFSEDFTVNFDPMEGLHAEALNGPNKLVRRASGFVLLTEIPVGQIDPQQRTEPLGPENSALIEYQIGTLDGEPLSILVKVPADGYGGLSSGIFDEATVEGDIDQLMEIAAGAVGAKPAKCTGERRCVRTCLIGGRAACCKYECI
jgi:hypothetical protein